MDIGFQLLRGYSQSRPSSQIVGVRFRFFRFDNSRRSKQKIKSFATLAYFDLVTGLANRRYVESRLGIMLAEYKKTLSPFGMLLSIWI